MWKTEHIFLETKTMDIARDDAECCPVKSLITCYTISEIRRWEFLQKYQRVKKWAFFKYLPWPAVSRLSVTCIRWPGAERSFWCKLDENRLKSVRDIYFFPSFSRWHFPRWKWRLSCAATSDYAAHIYRTRVPGSKSANNYRIGWKIFEKTNYMYFPLHLVNLENQNFGKKKDKLLLPTPRLITGLEFTKYVCEISWPNRSKRRKRVRKIKHRQAKVL